MRKHHEYKHNSAENYCNECEYKSSISSNLIRHKRLKHGKNETPVAKTNQTKLVMILFWKLVTLKKLTLKSTNLRPVKVAMHLKECFMTTHGLNIVVPDILATNVNIRQQNKVISLDIKHHNMKELNIHAMRFHVMQSLPLNGI